MPNVSRQRKAAAEAAAEILKNPKVRAALKARLVEVVMQAESQQRQLLGARRQQKHELRLAELKAAKPGPDLEALVSQVIDRKVKEARQEKQSA